MQTQNYISINWLWNRISSTSLSYIIFIASVDKKSNDLCKNKPQSQFMVGFGYIFKIQKEVKSTQNKPSCIKRVWSSKSQVEKVVKSKVAAMKWLQ